MNIKTIQKSSLDKLIRIVRKYYKTGDTDLLDVNTIVARQLSSEAFKNDAHWLAFADIASSIVSTRGLKPTATNEEIYRVFGILGYSVEAEDAEQERT